MFAQTQIASLLHGEHMHTIQALQRLEEYLINQTSRRPADAADPKVREVLDGVLVSVAAEVERPYSRGGAFERRPSQALCRAAIGRE